MTKGPPPRDSAQAIGGLFTPSRRAEADQQGDPDQPRVLVCVNHRLNARHPSCAGRGSEDLLARIETLASERGLENAIEAIRCLGHCADGPAMRIAPGGAFFDGVTEDALPAILDALEAARNNRA